MSKRRFTSAGVRQIVTHGMVATTALAAVTGVVAPGAAAAEPSKAAAQVVGIGTTYEQRIDAAAKVGHDPTPAELQLSDYDFIHLLWQKARDVGERLATVRTAAEEAMFSTKDEDRVRFITTGVGEARRLDQKREDERDAAARAARLAKSQALLAVGIPNSPELLELSDDNFIRAIVKHGAAGPEVRAAGIKALRGNLDDWREFIVNGAREAHKRDTENELKEIEEKDRQEAERKKELAARKSAAALFRITPTEAMLGLADDNFIRELLRTAPDNLKGSELFAAAQKVVLSSDPAEWRKFIHAGADEAYKRDDEIRRKKLAEENRRLALRIQNAAESNGVNPGLVEAAKKALAGGEADVAKFLREDSQYRARRQSIRASISDKASWYIRRSGADGEGFIEPGEGTFIAPVNFRSKQADREDATWVIVPALASNPGCFSFESVSKPGYYLKHMHDDWHGVLLAGDNGSSEFRKEATWCPRDGFNGYGKSFSSASNPEDWLMASTDGGTVKPLERVAEGFERYATWTIAAPLAP
ncbi:AbfB domain-containing protein [Streptomyces olivoreticuli]